MTFNAEIVLKGRDYAVTETLSASCGEPATWNDDNVRDVLREILRAIERAENPQIPAGRVVALRGFSWIVEPMDGNVVIAIEIPMGAAVAGPFAIGQRELDAMIARAVQSERQSSAPQTIH